MQKTTQKEINQIVWNACDTFRGTLNPDGYKDYILSMLFVKYLSDFYKEKKEQLSQRYNGDEKMIERALSREKFRLDDSCTFDYLYANRDKENLGEIINAALDRIEEDNPQKLTGIFRGVDFNDAKSLGDTKDRNSILKNLLKDFNNPKLDLSPSKLDGNDVIGDSYEYLIANFASDSGKKGGEFFTPSQVSSLLAMLVQAKDGDEIYDPTCGSGSLLIKAAKEIGSNNFAIYGQERNSTTHSLCRMNMFLHDINDANIQLGDTIRNPRILENDKLKKFDVVVANPPFSLDKWGADDVTSDVYSRFEFGIPPKSKGDYAFIQHMLASLNESGRMAVVVPHGVLFRGAAEGKIRQQIIDNNLLDAVIGLPSNLFFGTSIPACIMVFKKQKDSNDVLFIDASNEFEKGKNQNKLTDDNIKKIFDTYKSRESLEKYSHVASLEEIKENDYNLNIPRYVDTFEEEEPVDIEATKQTIAELEAKRETLKTKMAEYLKELGV
ncbi:type I restriction-modification system subunit M [Francisella tularensis subsp. novicida]|uniref:site-specific DNA-methyltransferase (adenine-specific) n=2 Tax=Francisella tularensis TaxID=263 RepID=A0A6I4RSZ9_FRATU|nr:type I restriction-modification system subunit M [Francisella tularensis]ABK89596.1 type I restriction-modification system, subunit M (methyltransferase) [Francisella tularensis subsp. novicida U112]AJI61013.1 type I restriction-modification system, M subunit [Francisella tularensis subsp. novicida U112]EDX19940.1 type I restriction-modification system, M subunit [Francisella tularensis subsp. novicida FTE]MBK2036631.1 type I restriction-modification system subunit M [Francisella tularensis 